MARMQSRWGTVLLGLAGFIVVAFALGWLKTLYYFDAFGIGLSSLELPVQAYLFESWFVLQNVFFFVLLFWFVVKTGRWWAIVLGVFYFFLPIASHYAFLADRQWFAEWLIHYRHTLLKFVPFGVYAATWLFDKRSFQSLKSLSWPHSKAALSLFVIFILAWAISTAKHFGSFDANRVLRSPQQYLSRVKLHPESSIAAQSQVSGEDELYVIYASPSRYFLWNHEGFRFAEPDQQVHLLVIPKEAVEWVESWKPFQVQPGSAFF